MTRPETASIAPRLQLLGAALLFSTGGAAIKASSLGAWQIASFRSGIAALALFLLLPAARRALGPKTLLVGVAYAATLVLFVLANRLATSASAIFLQATAPLYILLLGPLLLGERIRLGDGLLLAAVAAGLGLFFLGAEAPQATAPDPRLGKLLAAGSGVSWAFTVVGLRWLGRLHEGEPGRRDAAQGAVVAGNLLAFLGTLPLALPVSTWSAREVPLLGFLGVFQIALAYILVTRGLRGVTALEGSLLLLLEPALNPLWAWWVHAETPGGWALLGGGLILGSTAVRTLWAAAARGRL